MCGIMHPGQGADHVLLGWKRALTIHDPTALGPRRQSVQNNLHTLRRLRMAETRPVLETKRVGADADERTVGRRSHEEDDSPQGEISNFEFRISKL